MVRIQATRSLRAVLIAPAATSLLALAGVLGAPAASGDDAASPPALAPGMRVRILTTGPAAAKLTGTIDRIDDNSVTLAMPGRSEPVSVRRDQVAELDVSSGPRSRWVNAAIGGGIGAAASAITCSSTDHGSSIVSHSDVAAGCAVVGALVGAAIGAAISPGERWTEVPTSRYRITVVPRPDHGLTLAVAWGL